MLVLLILFVLHLVRIIFFKQDNTILSCGLFGFSGIKGKKVNWKNVEILGIFNTERGTDSCGYYFSGHIEKGIKENANWSRFIVGKELIKGNLDTNMFLGHTRKSTIGAHTEDNAHPFTVNNLVLTHNGIIRNIWELAKDGGFAYNDYTVDSHGLTLLIDKEGFEVLKKYKGYAALAMTFTDDPESLYLYHGATRQATDMKLHEERPLFILKQPEGIYYSSIKESLQFINSSKKYEIETVPYNKVIRITNGELTDYEFRVDREEIEMPAIPPVRTYIPGVGSNISRENLPIHSTNFVQNQMNFHSGGDNKDIKKNTLLEEVIPSDSFTQDLFYWKGRYWKDKATLLDGIYKIDRRGKILSDTVKENLHEDDIFFFIRGVMIDSEKKFRQALLSIPDIRSNLKQNTAYQLSPFSRYPVACLENEGLNVINNLRFKWYKKHSAYNGDITAKFSQRIYTITKGEFISVRRQPGTDVAIGQSPFKEDEKSKPQTEESRTWLDALVESVQSFCTKDLSTFNEKKLNENFLEFVDFFNKEISTCELGKDLLEERTNFLIRYLIKTNSSFIDYINTTDNKGFCSKENIRKCFIDHTPQDVIMQGNRYFKKSLYSTSDPVEESSADCCGISTYESLQDDDAEFLTNGYVPIVDKADAIFNEVRNGSKYNEVFAEVEGIMEYIDDMKSTASSLCSSTNDIARDIGKNIMKTVDKLRTEVEDKYEQFKEDITPNMY